MQSILVSGSTGFVGRNVIHNFKTQYNIINLLKNSEININQEVVLHLAGKAHDLKHTTNIHEYYTVNTELTKKIYDAFLNSNARVFITLSSVKAVADSVDTVLTEEYVPNPITHYGKSKLFAEKYILSKILPDNKRVYILRPCMIYGPGNKGNLNLLYSFVTKGFPWPFGFFENSRSYLSIENLCFIIKELIEREDIPSGVYNLADDIPLSTNELIKLIAESKGQKAMILNFRRSHIKMLARFGDLFNLPLNSERLKKLTETYIVSNTKIKNAIGKPLPISSKDGLIRTFQSFVNND